MKKIVLYTILVVVFCNSYAALGQKINWISFHDLEAAQKTEQKKVFVDVYTDWCGWCKKMDASTFLDEKLVGYLNENYYCVKLDGEEKEILKYKGQEFKFVKSGRRGYNELPHQLLRGRLSYPTLVFLDENSDVLQDFRGFRNAKDLLSIAVFLGEDIYKKKDWATYVNETKGKE